MKFLEQECKDYDCYNIQHLLIETKMLLDDMKSWKYDCIIAKDEKSSDDAG